MFGPILSAHHRLVLRRSAKVLDHTSETSHRVIFQVLEGAREDLSPLGERVKEHFDTAIRAQTDDRVIKFRKLFQDARDEHLPKLTAVQDQTPDEEKLKLLAPAKSALTYAAFQQGIQDQNKLLTYMQSLLRIPVSTTDQELTDFYEKVDSFKCASFAIIESGGAPALHYTYTDTGNKPYVQMGYPTEFIKLFIEATASTTKVVDDLTVRLKSNLDQLLQTTLAALEHAENDHTVRIIYQHTQSIISIWDGAIWYGWWAYFDQGLTVANKFVTAYAPAKTET